MVRPHNDQRTALAALLHFSPDETARALAAHRESAASARAARTAGAIGGWLWRTALLVDEDGVSTSAGSITVPPRPAPAPAPAAGARFGEAEERALATYDSAGLGFLP